METSSYAQIMDLATSMNIEASCPLNNTRMVLSSPKLNIVAPSIALEQSVVLMAFYLKKCPVLANNIHIPHPSNMPIREVFLLQSTRWISNVG